MSVQHSYPLAVAVVDISSIRSGASVCPEDTRDEFDLRHSSMLIANYETDGLRLTGEVRHLRWLPDRGLSRRSSDALSENVRPQRIYDAMMASYGDQSATTA